ncbi:unnamed protein product [Cuscuta epithymum]|uniref:Uncharacterized protein n=1 Tax=Cuscuta epithymum TaxID=186058 RepID=A0AAV0ERV5_9ASTE|nr:unnamed protein product [Cuscuta epithymum]
MQFLAGILLSLVSNASHILGARYTTSEGSSSIQGHVS